MTSRHKSYYGGTSLWFRIFTADWLYQLRGENNIKVVPGCLLHIARISKSVDPLHFGLTTKPGSLPASVLSRRSLGSFDGLFLSEFTPQALNRFLVSNRLQCLRVFAEPEVENFLHFFEQTTLEHPHTPRVDSFGKEFAIRVESHLMNAETLQRSDRVCPKNVSDGLTCLHAYLDRAD